MEKTRGTWGARFLGEALAIFAGVALALAADDWRQTRSEAEEAQAALDLVVEDLKGDSAEFAIRGSVMERHAAAAAWLIEEWDRSHQPADSVEAAIQEFATGGVARFNRAAFEGLRDSNRLRLIESDSMRMAISRYYQRTQVGLSNFWDLAYESIWRLNEALAPHVRQPLGRDPGALWPAGDQPARLRRPWNQVAADPMLEASVHQYGTFAAFLALRYRSGQQATGDLIRLLESR